MSIKRRQTLTRATCVRKGLFCLIASASFIKELTNYHCYYWYVCSILGYFRN